MAFGLALASATALAVPAVTQQPLGGMGGTVRGELDQADINAGRMVATGGTFGEMRIDCIRCHGLDGTGDASGAFPRLAGQGAWYLYKTLNDFAQGRRQNEVMTPIARTLTDEQMREVAAYYASLPAKSVPGTSTAGPETLQEGGAVAAVGSVADGVPACIGCHGAEGEGQPPIVPALAGQSAPYLEHQLQQWKAGERDGDPLGVMEAIARNMSDDQIHAVAAYYAALPPQRAGAETAAVKPLPPQQPAGALEPPYLEPPVAAEQDTQ
jgi:cytochrome c553